MSPVRIVVDLSNNHNGRLASAHTLIDLAKAAGVDDVKFQCYLPSELIALRGNGPAPEPWGSQGWTMESLYEKASTPHAWFPELVKHCEDIGIGWFSSVFGLESLALLESLNCPTYKLAALDNRSPLLQGALSEIGKPIIVSERFNYESRFGRVGEDVTRLYCPEGYPQTRFEFGGLFEHECRQFDGFSYHGTDFQVPAYAVAAGARIIECHMQLYAEPSILESAVSLTDRQVVAMVREIRKVEQLL